MAEQSACCSQQKTLGHHQTVVFKPVVPDMAILVLFLATAALTAPAVDAERKMTVAEKLASDPDLSEVLLAIDLKVTINDLSFKNLKMSRRTVATKSEQIFLQYLDESF
ncbi:hypothetical protein EVAR_39862_1 [Eumeta japonica]|uniref:Uncharacterized protein n=1 Tax=Eumeta variegata TaxID=151549 RepID=A0A4C1WQR2_EUMVA|nr:hypothetical protein EVAR_39862_1 [Eumeta japonica]